MKRLAIVSIAMTGAVLVAAQAGADDWKGQSFSAKRQALSQVIDCMRKRMSSDRGISYNEAAKVCKDQVTRRLETSTAGPLVAAAADSPAK